MKPALTTVLRFILLFFAFLKTLTFKPQSVKHEHTCPNLPNRLQDLHLCVNCASTNSLIPLQALYLYACCFFSCQHA